MRYVARLFGVMCCTLGLWAAVTAVHAGPREDCQQSQNHALAIRACTEIIRRDRKAGWAYHWRGAAYASKSDYNHAIADYNEAIRLDPNATAYNARGKAHNAKGAYDHAIADYNEAIRLNPSFAYAYNGRGKAYSGKGDYDRAITDYNEAVRLAPNNAIAFARRGRAFEAIGDRAKAAEDYNRALALPARNQLDGGEQAEARQRLAALQAAPPAAAPAPAPTPAVAVTAPVPAAPTAAAPPTPSTPLGRRVALVIGNAGYKVGPLQNPGNDAAAVAQALEKQLGFDKVILKLDLTSEGFRTALREFSREAAGAGLALVYFAGHGTEVGGKNYLIPVDAVLSRAGDLTLEAIPLDTVLDQLAGVTKLKLVILDACRNNIFPLAGAQRSASRGLFRIEPDENTLVIYAAKDGTTADDGVGRKHSPFTAALLKHIATPGLELRFLFGKVRDEVLVATSRAQQPYVYGTLGGEQIFLRP